MLLRPFAVSLSGPVLDVAPTETGYAVLTAAGIDVLDGNLQPLEHLAGDGASSALYVLTDGRFLTCNRASGAIYIGRSGEALAKREDLGTTRAAYPTLDGFVAIGTDKVWIDRNGEGRWLDGLRASKGSCTWGDRIVVASGDGVTVIDAAGELRTVPVADVTSVAAFGDLLAVRVGKTTVVYDAELAPLATLLAPDELRARIGDTFVATGPQGLAGWVLDTPREVFATRDELSAKARTRGYASQHEVDSVTADLSPEAKAEWSRELGVKLVERAFARAWHHELPAPDVLRAVGDRVALCAGRHNAIVTSDGAMFEPGPRQPMVDAQAFGTDVAMLFANHAEVVWWHSGAAPIDKLPHDVAPTLLRSVPAGLVVAEGRHLYLWRPDVQGPEYVPVTTSIPLEVPVLVSGHLVRALAPKRFFVLGVDTHKRPIALDPDATWRGVIGKDDALAIMQRLVARDTEGELPPLPAGDDLNVQLAQLPAVQTATLHARALFAPSMLDDRTRKAAAWARESFYAELGLALGLSGRVVAACGRGRRYPLVPPKELAGYDYLGSFTTSGALVVADPAYVGSKRAPGAFSLAVRVKGSEGLWHVFVRNGDGVDATHTAELVAIHTDGFDTYATDVVGKIGVDSGCAGIYDKACPKRDKDAPVEEGVQGGLGALAWSGYGDGRYPVYAANIRGVIVKLRIGFLDGTDKDRTFAVPRTGRQYSPKVHFSLGEVIEHPKFGSGTITAVNGDGKIDVAFADGKRTLVHLKLP